MKGHSQGAPKNGDRLTTPDGLTSGKDFRSRWQAILQSRLDSARKQPLVDFIPAPGEALVRERRVGRF